MMNEQDFRNEIGTYVNYFRALDEKFELYKHIKKHVKDYEKETNNIANYLIVVLDSLLDEVLIGTYKFFDKNSGKNLYDLMKKCREFFQNNCPEKIHIIDEIEKEINSHDTILLNLKTYRDKHLAHTDKEYFGNASKLLKDYPTTYEEIEEIHTTIKELLNKLSSIINGVQYGYTPAHVKDEYDYVLKCLKYCGDNKVFYKRNG